MAKAGRPRKDDPLLYFPLDVLADISQEVQLNVPVRLIAVLHNSQPQTVYHVLKLMNVQPYARRGRIPSPPKVKHKVIDRLSDWDRLVLIVDSWNEGQSQQQIGDAWGLSRERVRQIMVQAVKRGYEVRPSTMNQRNKA